MSSLALKFEHTPHPYPGALAWGILKNAAQHLRDGYGGGEVETKRIFDQDFADASAIVMLEGLALVAYYTNWA